MNKKILIVVLSFEKEPYVSLENTIRNTWALEKPEGIEIIYYYGNSQEDKLIGDKLYLNSPEGLRNVGHKTLKMYQYVLENFDFDYVYRTNSSSYIDIEKLQSFVKDKPMEKFYCGVIGRGVKGIKFASGSGYFISKDLVGVVLKNKSKWQHGFIDDVALGLLLNNYKIYPADRFDLNNIEKIDTNYYHYRVKTPNNRQIDVKKMKMIHKQKKQDNEK